MRSLLCVLLLVGSVVGQEVDPEVDPENVIKVPEVVIEAPDTVQVGDMIIVDVSKSVGAGFDLQIIPEPKYVRVFESGKIICTSTGNKTAEYLFIVSCALNEQSDVKTHLVKVEGGDLIIPEPGKSITAKIMEWCKSVQSPTIRDDALKLSQSFASIAAIIKSGAFSSAEEIVNATKTSNQDALGENLEYWIPVFDGLMTELKTMAESGLLQTPESHAPVWNDVATGLRNYANSLEN